MPYRVDITGAAEDVLDLLIDLGALDVESSGDGVAAIFPDSLPPAAAARALPGFQPTVSPARGRDNESVWLLRPRPFSAAGLWFAPPGADVPADALYLVDSEAFGTGHHATTVLCLEVLAEIIASDRPGSLLDVGTGSGILALAARRLGVDRVTGVDIDPAALAAASENARLNNVELRLLRGGPDAVTGAWPLVVANVLASPLIEMAPVLVRRLGHRGRLALSGIPDSLAGEVRQVYRRLGVHWTDARSRDGWTALVGQASW